MNLLAPISTIMTTNVRTVASTDSLTLVEEIFQKYPIHHLPVVDHGSLTGMVSKADFLLFKRGFTKSKVEEKYDHFRLRNTKVGEIMTQGLAKLDHDDKINVALEVFKKNFLHALPVMKGERLIGIVTTHDIIANLADDKSAINQYVVK